MRFRIKENDIIAIVEQFLRSQKLVKTLRCLEKESNIIIGSLDEVSPIFVARESLN